MTDLTAREVVEKLNQYDDLPLLPRVNIHFLATAPGNEHLLKFMTEKPDNPIRVKGKRIGIIATHGVEETKVSIPRKWFEARGATCHLVSPHHIEYAPAFDIQFPEIAKTHVLAIPFTENSGWIPIDARIEGATVENYDAVYLPGGAWNPDQLRANSAVSSFLQKFQAIGKPYHHEFTPSLNVLFNAGLVFHACLAVSQETAIFRRKLPRRHIAASGTLPACSDADYLRRPSPKKINEFGRF